MKIKITLLAWLLCNAGLTFAQPGTLDNTFGTSGKVTTLAGSTSSHGYATAIQADGKIVVAGDFASSNGYNDFLVVRYNSNGTLDNTFGGGNGKAGVDFGNHATAYGIAIQSDGKIVVAGAHLIGSDNDFALARLKIDGTIDNSFGFAGRVVTDLGGDGDIARSVAMQTDGKIVAAGETNKDGKPEFALVRYNSDGSLDNTFNLNGKVLTLIGTQSGARSVAIQTDGKIIAAGHYYAAGTATGDNFAVARYKTNGTLDNTFAGDGKASIHFGDNVNGVYDNRANSVAINKSNGQIVVAGGSYSVVNDYDTLSIAVTKLGTGGKRVSNFGVSGKVITRIGFWSEGNSVAIQANGKIVVAGHAFVNEVDDYALVRYNANGSFDNTFGSNSNGIVTTDVGGHDVAWSMAIQQDGKIVLAGETLVGEVHKIAVARYNGDPVPLTASTENISAATDNKLSASPIIKLFPNPAKDLLSIAGMDASTTKTISIVDMNGRIVQTTTTVNSTHEWNIASLPAGTYYLLIDDKKKKMSLKFVKE